MVLEDTANGEVKNSTENDSLKKARKDTPPLSFKPFSSSQRTPASNRFPAITNAEKTTPSYHPEVPHRPVSASSFGTSRNFSCQNEDSKRLFVGQQISLKGTITSCECLIVEGTVEITLTGGRFIEVMPSGLFRGNIDVDDADISGHFEGELIVRNRLTVRSGGKITGAVRYGNITIESGGEISGDVVSLTDNKAKNPSLSSS